MRSKNLVGRALLESDWDLIERESFVLANLDGFKLREMHICSCGGVMWPGAFVCRICYLAMSTEKRNQAMMRTSQYWAKVAARREERYGERYERRLYWDFTKEFSRIAYRAAHRQQSTLVGEMALNSKLAESDVLEIRAIYAPVPGRSTYALAKRFGVSQPTILQIVRRETWRHLPTISKPTESC